MTDCDVCVHRMVRPRSGTLYSRLVMGVGARARVARVVRVLEGKVFAIVHTLQRLGVA